MNAQYLLVAWSFTSTALCNHLWQTTIFAGMAGMPHFEQSFSDDGGKTWEANWITDSTRVNSERDKAH